MYYIQTPASADKKKYGIDSKNTNYKPSGGNVKIFDKKLEVKVGSRIDSKPSPSKGGTPRTRKYINHFRWNICVTASQGKNAFLTYKTRFDTHF